MSSVIVSTEEKGNGVSCKRTKNPSRLVRIERVRVGCRHPRVRKSHRKRGLLTFVVGKSSRVSGNQTLFGTPDERDYNRWPDLRPPGNPSPKPEHL